MVATFTDPNGTHAASSYTATIDWGDGQRTPGMVSGPNGSNQYTVTGLRPDFTEEGGSLPFTVTVTENFVSTKLTVVPSGISSPPITFFPYFAHATSGFGTVVAPPVAPTG